MSSSIAALENITEYNLVDDFGAIGDGMTDNFSAWQAALDASILEPIRLIIPGGTYYSKGAGNLELWPATSKGIHIKGVGNPVILPENNRYNTWENYFMRLQMDPSGNAGVEIEGIIVDGSKNPQDMYFWMEDRNLTINDIPLQRGFRIENALEVSVHDSQFRHMYGGYCVHLGNYKKVDLARIRVDDVGGDDKTDSFGMIFYLGGHQTDAVVTIDNVYANGKVSPRNPKWTAWIGVVLENGSIQSSNQDAWLLDKNTTVTVTNSEFMDFETVFHIESLAGNVYWNVDNVKARAKDYMIAAGVKGSIRERTNGLVMEMTPWGRNDIISGLYYTEKEQADNISGKNVFSMFNSVITAIEVEGARTMPVMASYGDYVVGFYNHVTFNNVPDKLLLNGSGKFVDCEINLGINNNRTKDNLHEFSDPEVQYYDYVRTGFNKFGAWKEAKEGNVPDPYDRYSWLTAPALAIHENIVTVVGPPDMTLLFNKLYINGKEVPFNDRQATLTEFTGEVSLKATTLDGAQVIRSTINR